MNNIIDEATNERQAFIASTSTSTCENLQRLVDKWNDELGGRIRIRLHCWVEAGPDATKEAWYAVRLGDPYDALSNEWTSHCTNPLGAFRDAKRKWELDGSPVKPSDIELARLRAKAKELGYQIVEAK